MRKGLCGVLLCGALAACSDGGDGSVLASGRNAVEVTIGKRGGRMELEQAASVDIPRGALDERTSMRAAKGDLEDFERPSRADYEVIGDPLIVSPHRLELREPATIEQVIRDERSTASELRVLRLEDEEDRSWEVLRELRIEVVEPEEREPNRDVRADDSLSDKRRIRYELDTFSVLLPVRFIPNGLCAGEEAGTVCREAAGPCDVAEECDGRSDDCPADTFEASDVVCRDSAGSCDVQETCPGDAAECPEDALRGAGSVCAPARQACEEDAVCDGESVDCPDNPLAAAGTECRQAEGACDVAETCNGEEATCPSDLVAAAGTVCEEAAGCNTAASCDGQDKACPIPPPAAQGTPCDDGLHCTVGDSCNGLGTCVAGTGDPCLQNVGDGDDDCNEACQEVPDSEQGYACTAREPDGTACVTSPACALATCSAGACQQQAPCPVFVNIDGGVDDAGTGPCGTSWSTACRTVQKGSQVAAAAGNPRVFVARGHYASDGGTLLTMAPDTAYYGSFAGSEDQPDQRTLFVPDAGVPPDPSTATVLNAAGSNDPVVVGASGARLDGFTVTDMDAGVGTGTGLGMRNQGDVGAGDRLTGLTVANSRFYGTTTDGGVGRGMHNDFVEDLTVENTAFDYNKRGAVPHDGGFVSNDLQGAGMQLIDGLNVTITDTRFVGNSVHGSTSSETQASGGGLYNAGGSGLQLTRVDFVDNRASADLGGRCYGGGMASLNAAQNLNDVTFEGNEVGCSFGGRAAGGGLYDEDTTSTLSNVRFAGNTLISADRGYGAGYAVEATGTIRTGLSNAEFTGNTAIANEAKGVGMAVVDTSDNAGPSVELDVDGARFERNSASSAFLVQGGGLFAFAGNADVTVSNAEFVAHDFYTYGGSAGLNAGGGLFTDVGSVTLSSVAFVQNRLDGSASGGTGAMAEGGGAALRGSAAASLNTPRQAAADVAGSRFHDNQTDCFVYGGDCETFGGGLSTTGVATTLVDTDFVGNAARASASYSAAAYGGGLHHVGAHPLTVTNVGFVGNAAVASAMFSGGLVLEEGGGAALNLSGASYSFDSATFVNNSPEGLYVGNGNGDVWNSIFANGASNVDAATAPGGGARCTTTPGTGDVALSTPIDAGELTVTAGGHVYLPAGSPCEDAGNDSRADTAFGSIDWRNLTTRLDGTLDMGTVDMGRHYAAGQPVILSFTASGGADLSWDTRQPGSTVCTITDRNGNEPYTLTSESGTLTSAPFSGDVMLLCRNGGLSVRATTFLGQFSEL